MVAQVYNSFVIQSQEDQEFKASLGYIVKHCLKKPWAGDVTQGR
jgi:hypothetical protein